MCVQLFERIEVSSLDQRSSIMKARTGSIVKRKPRRKGSKATWWARVTYVDPKTGKRNDLQRRGQNKAHARDLLQALLRDIDATDGQAPHNERMAFADLCDYAPTDVECRPTRRLDSS